VTENKKAILYGIFFIYFFIDLFIGFAFAQTHQKICLLNNQQGHYTITPLVNILLYNLQMKMLSELPSFSMKLYYNSVLEVVFSIGLVMVVSVLGSFILLRRREKC